MRYQHNHKNPHMSHSTFYFLLLFFSNSDFTKQDVSNVEGKPQECDNFSETSVLEEVGLCWTELQQEWLAESDVCLTLVDSAGCLRNAF